MFSVQSGVRTMSLLIMLASGLLIVPSALAALVAPFGLGAEQPLSRQIISIVLVINPILLLIAGLGALAAFDERRWIKRLPIALFLLASLSTANFWTGAI